jgi:peptidoglycan/LPS O-acetylase OafA/YrhL
MRLEYRSEVDGMRALAIILVLMFHAYPSWLSGGFIGVDVFLTSLQRV